ncbi:DUF1294 domain-containing protein [Thalassotalea mangrovi]|uniref:DUF1294 domain-containing protein n=2 Tax=Thalassotalea mangrovi TaxID=2572245 RepID=A0A4U1B6G8_9GAMM|nr:DUF1294 domain-containing protein [Thalassotalea mangrovi]
MRLFPASIFMMTLALAYLPGLIPREMFLGYLGVSLFTYLAYATDKHSSERGGKRTQESSLHLLSTIGGWPGAAFAQQILRHKTQKPSFRAVYWITVLANIALFAWYLSPYNVLL